MFGFLNINKPLDKTSFDVIRDLKKIFRTSQIGHGGTLDKLASGVLPVAIGKATRLINYLPKNKTYISTFVLGITTDTLDFDGRIIAQFDGQIDFEKSYLTQIISSFSGEIYQLPPVYSAVKYNGKRLSDYARQNIELPNVSARLVEINQINILNIALPEITIEVFCQSGTYIRSLVRDIGIKLQTGATVKSILRTTSGKMNIINSISLDELDQNCDNLDKYLLKPKEVLDLDFINTDNDNIIEAVYNGRYIELDNNKSKILAIETNNNILAVLEHKSNFQYHPRIVFKR